MNPRDYIKQNEGLKLKPYICPAGRLTIGYGRNLQDRGITRQEADVLFEDDFTGAEIAVRDLVPNYDNLSPARQAVLLDMAFNLGKMGLQGFKRMLRAVRDEDFPRAALEITDSFYAKQIPNRARRNQEMMLNG